MLDTNPDSVNTKGFPACCEGASYVPVTGDTSLFWALHDELRMAVGMGCVTCRDDALEVVDLIKTKTSIC